MPQRFRIDHIYGNGLVVDHPERIYQEFRIEAYHDILSIFGYLDIFIHRTDEKGQVFFLGQTFLVASTWPHRLVRCNVDFTNQRIEFYRLRRREPLDQPLMKTLEFEFPSRIFRPQTD